MRPSRIFGVDCLTIISELSEVLCYVRHTIRMLFDLINPESFCLTFGVLFKSLLCALNQMKGQKLVLYQSAHGQFTFQ